MDILVSSFLLVLHASITASIAVLLIILISKLFGKHIGVRLNHALWIIVVIKLIIPLQFQSNLNMFNLLHEKYQSIYEIQNKNILQNMAYNASDFLREGKNYWNSESKSQSVQIDSSSEKIGYKKQSLTKEYVVNDVLNIASCIWLAGVVSGAIFLLIIEQRFKRKFLILEELKDLKFIQLLEQCKKKVNIDIHIPVYVCDSFKSPCILGIFKPRIYIPSCICDIGEYNELYHVLLHELIHYKRKDLVYNFLAVLAVIIHWFNPIVWYGMKKMRLKRECACDAYVLENIGEEKVEEYGMALINFSKLVSNSKALQLAVFFETKNQLKRRIEMIKNFKKGSYRMSAAAIACCIVASGVAFTTVVNGESIKANNIAAVASSNDSLKKQKSEFITDSPVKMYSDLKKVEEIAGFKFKVPDNLPENYRVTPVFRVIKVSDKVNALSINFHQTGGKAVGNKLVADKVFNFQVSKENMEEVLKEEMEQINKYRDGKKCEVSKEPMNLAGINGFNITIKSTFSEDCQETGKFFVWQNEGLWYSIEHKEDLQYSKGTDNSMNLPADDVAKIASSIKYVENIKNVSYSEEMSNIESSIYDKDDLKKAKELLGFDPKVLLSINKAVNIEGLSIKTLGSSNTVNKDAKHELNAFYNYSNSCSLRFKQVKDCPNYENIKKNGYAEVKDDNDKIQHEKVQTLNINNKEVFKYEYYFEEAKNEPIKSQNYIWKEDGFYCQVSINSYDKNSVENPDELVKKFVDSKPID